MMGLPWVRLDTQYPHNPKVLDLIEQGKWRAVSVYSFSLCYCGAHGTDGYLPRVSLGSIHGTARVAAELVAAGLWRADPRGWFIPDYLDYQQESAKTAEVLAAKQSASKKGNCVRWHGAGCGCWRDSH